MQIPAVPPIISSEGNLHLHAQQGAKLTLTFKDEDGADKVMVGRTVVFETESGGISVTAQPGDLENQMTLDFPQGTFDALLNTQTKFIVIDTTDANHEIVWAGTLFVRGWV